MRFKATLAGLACAVGALGLAACSSSGTTASSGGSSSGGSSTAAPCISPSTTSGSSSSGGSSTTLAMEQSPVASIADIMNPFNQTSSAVNTLGATQLIYEPLIQFDEVKPTISYPWLATKYAWSSGGKTITFTLRSGVKFTDGEPFDAANAAWEFNLIKQYPDINTYGLPITSASAPNATTLVINFKTAQYTDLYNIANTVQIPEGKWKNVGDPGKYADTAPVGTGPYTLKSFSSQGLDLTANPGYWGGKSHVPNIDFPVYSSNTPANQALETGQLQWAGNFVQNIQSEFLNKNPGNHCWDYGLQTETLIPNLTTYPFSGPDGLPVREAISDGVNRQQISGVGEDGQQPPVQGAGSLTGLTLPLDQQYVTSSVSQYTATQNQAKAKSVLKADGWTMGSDGYFEKNGKTLEFTVEDPAEYSDFITDDNILQSQLKQVGIKVDIKATSLDAWNSDLATGNFNSMMHWGNGGISPYNMYDNWLDTTLDTGADAKNATGDYERFSGPEANQAEADLQAYAAAAPSTTGAPTTQQIQDVDALGTIIAKDLPVIPLFYGVAWGDYSSANWTGWPSPSNPYSSISPNGPENEVVILHLRPAK
jgi:peptide/nickel transport system substrate-binding protein